MIDSQNASNSQQLLSSQNTSRRSRNAANKQKKEEWQIQLNSAQNKAEKLRILREHIGPPRLYPEKLNILTPSDLGRPLLRSSKYRPLGLFYRFIPQELFSQIAEHTN